MKGYLSVRETAAKRKASERMRNQYIQEGPVSGADRFGKSWAISESGTLKAGRKKHRRKKPSKLLFFGLRVSYT